MRLGTKIIVAAIGSIALSVVVGLVIQRNVIRSQGIELTRNTMRAALMEAENVRMSVSDLNERGAFDQTNLLQELAQGHDLRSSTLYQTIPVVAAWKAIEKVAEKEGYEFRVPKEKARNAKNLPTADEVEILNAFQNPNMKEYFKIDRERNQIVFARPIILTPDCLKCHGDPKNSPTGDGKDFLGFEMEGWKSGEVHGAFVLKSSLDRVDKVVAAGMGSTLLWSLPVAALVSLGFYFFNRMSILKPLGAAITTIDHASENTATAASQVSATSQALAEGSGHQASALEETSASLEEMSSTTMRNAENAAKAKTLANRARTVADAGAADVVDMSQAMDQIKSASDNISKIIRTIDEIAFQTNILALNAAVEAARAGEAGMGFAVVADEVRNLAQRSAVAARETAAKIEDSIVKSQRGVDISNKVASSLQEILHKARELDELVNEIAESSKEQSQGIQQINSAVSQIDRVTQSNAASAEESSSAAHELSAQAGTMKDSVQQLLYLIGGNVAEEKLELAPKQRAKVTQPKLNDQTKSGNGAAAPRNPHPPASSVETRKSDKGREAEFVNF